MMLLKLVGAIELGLLFSASEFDKANVRSRKAAHSPSSRCRDRRWNRIWENQPMSASHYLAFSSHNLNLKLALASVGWTKLSWSESQSSSQPFLAVSSTYLILLHPAPGLASYQLDQKNH